MGRGDILTGIEKSIAIKASPEKVWEMLAWDRHPEWIDAMKSVGYTSEVRTPEDKFGVGATAHITGPVEFDVEITESLENEKISSRYSYSIGGVRNVTGSYILKPTEGGTEMTLVYNYEMPWGIFGKVIDKLDRAIRGERQVEKSLEKLKSIVEENNQD